MVWMMAKRQSIEAGIAIGSRRYSWPLLAVVCASLLLPTRLSLVSFAIVVAIFGYYLPLAGRTLLQRIIWSYVITSVLIAIVYMLAWWLGLPVSPLVVIGILTGVAWYLALTRKPEAEIHRIPPLASNWHTIGVGVLVCMFVILPVLRQPATSSILRYAAHTGDDINHISIVESIRHAHGYLYSSRQKPSTTGIEFRHVNYPQGWHINAALFESLFVRLAATDSISTRVTSYWVFTVFWLFIATYFVAELLFVCFRLVSKHRDWAINLALATCAAALAAIILIPLLGFGFQSFVAALVFMLVACVAAAEYMVVATSQQKHGYLLLLALMTLAATYVWILSGLAMATGILVAVVANIKLQRGYLKSLPAWLWTSLAFFALLTVSQMYILMKFSERSTASLNIQGAIPHLSMLGVLLVLVTAVIAIYRLLPKARWMAWLLAGISVEWLVSALYQQISFGTQYYYVIKLGYIVLLLSSAMLLPILINEIASRSKNRGLQIIWLGLALAAIVLVAGIDPTKSAYPLKDSAAISRSTADRILATPKSMRYPVFETANPEESYLSTKFWTAVWINNDPAREALLRRMNDAIYR